MPLEKVPHEASRLASGSGKPHLLRKCGEGHIGAFSTKVSTPVCLPL